MSRGNATNKSDNDQEISLLEDFSERLLELASTVVAWFQVVGGRITKFFSKHWRKVMKAYVRWADPRLEKYREKGLVKETSKKEEKTPIQEKTNHEEKNPKFEIEEIVLPDPRPPKDLDEFLHLIEQTPTEVISERERAIIAGAMNFGATKVRKVMIPADRIIYVKSDEVLGPLVLNELYQADYTHFPVIDKKEKVIGILHTASFNHLTNKDTPIVKDIVDKELNYLRSDYTLDQALIAFLRANCQLMLVIDKGNNLVGMLTFKKLIEYLTGPIEDDDFSKDNDRAAVLSR